MEPLVLVLGPHAERLGLDRHESTEEPVTPEEVARFDLLVSFGYRHILNADVLDTTPGVNLHVALLPWNRGADPNLWSWLEDTPKGVTVHWLTAGLDKGPVVAQHEVDLDPAATLASTYGRLMAEMVEAFNAAWPAVLDGDPGRPQQGGGTYHRSSDKAAHPEAMPQGWDTPCWQVRRYGETHGLTLDRRDATP